MEFLGRELLWAELTSFLLPFILYLSGALISLTKLSKVFSVALFLKLDSVTSQPEANEEIMQCHETED